MFNNNNIHSPLHNDEAGINLHISNAIMPWMHVRDIFNII